MEIIAIDFYLMSNSYEQFLWAMESKVSNQSNKTNHKTENKPKLKESNDPMDLIRMQTEVGLFESMAQSKTLTIIVILAIMFFGGFFFFLYKMAGAA
ncbi:hypothetical protein [Thalassotalea euphylliae]|uniref:Uncharacterized protein n=1 Tax=Thalassotalea euphylliae TaxID=1655234 RepID=A0A3E0UFQ4_9GAMM|nr:hypothetical protein [Thalassotalea euphylliae]REL35861.1 hypothetical protein DXX92_11245 [Thalassotalea euphylliae]